MRLRVLLEPHHGASYEQLVALARATEEAGSTPSSGPTTTWADGRRPATGPTDSWTTLAGLAARPTGPAWHPDDASTYRRPGPLAITVATVDAMSGGRADWASAPPGSNASTGTSASRSLRWPSGSTGWPSSSRSSPGCGPPRRGPVQLPRPALPARGVRQHSPRPRGGRPSSSAAAGRGARPRWPRGSPTSSTAAWRTGWRSGSRTSAGSASSPGATRPRCGCPPRCRCAGRDPRRGRPPGRRAGRARGPDAADGRHRHPRRHPRPDRRACTRPARTRLRSPVRRHRPRAHRPPRPRGRVPASLTRLSGNSVAFPWFAKYLAIHGTWPST